MVAVAVATMSISCSKENVGSADKTQAVLSVKISSAKLNSRASVSTPISDAYKTPLTDGVIFILDAANSITKAVAIVSGTGVNGIESANGQQITAVESNSKVYVVANIGSTLVTEWTTAGTIPANLTALNTKVLDINGANGQGTEALPLNTATLANSEGTAEPIVLGTGTGGASGTNQGEAKVTVSLVPTITRVELFKIEGTGNITGFTVEGVYIDKYYPQYTIAGSTAGTIFNNNQAVDFSSYEPVMAIETAYQAASLIASPTPSVWGFNLAAGATPRIIVKLTNVTGTTSTGATIPSGTYYLTVKTFAKGGTPLTSFARGKVYRLGHGTDAGLKFDENDITITPNPIDIDLWVTVDVAEWEFEEITGGL